MTEIKNISQRLLMTDEFDENEELDAENQRVWEEYTREFEQIDQGADQEEENFKALLDNFENDGLDLPIEESRTPENHIIVEPLITKRPNGEDQLDRRTDEKLRKGKMTIEARLDLHGMNRAAAHENLGYFILRCAQQNMRHVLVITGKGKSKTTSEYWLSQGTGILKTQVPYWLNSPQLKPFILKYVTAQPKDGGSGALYVYLKRQR